MIAQYLAIDYPELVAKKIPNSKLVVYKGLGHMAYEEGKDFNSRVLEFK